MFYCLFLFLVVGFIYLVDEIKFMLISIHYFRVAEISWI